MGTAKKNNRNQPQHTQRVYVKVLSAFDTSGYMQPKEMVWNNRTLPIDGIRDFIPAGSEAGKNLPGDCYTVVIKGSEKHLFFQRNDSRFNSTFGRWFVECSG